VLVAQKAVRGRVGVAWASVRDRRGSSGQVHCHRRRSWGEAAIASGHGMTDLRGDVGPFFCCGGSLSGETGRSLTALLCFLASISLCSLNWRKTTRKKLSSDDFPVTLGGFGWNIALKNLRSLVKALTNLCSWLGLAVARVIRALPAPAP
jgi:hypothetical protein